MPRVRCASLGQALLKSESAIAARLVKERAPMVSRSAEFDLVPLDESEQWEFCAVNMNSFNAVKDWIRLRLEGLSPTPSNMKVYIRFAAGSRIDPYPTWKVRAEYRNGCRMPTWDEVSQFLALGKYFSRNIVLASYEARSSESTPVDVLEMEISSVGRHF